MNGTEEMLWIIIIIINSPMHASTEQQVGNAKQYEGKDLDCPVTMILDCHRSLLEIQTKR